MNTHKTSKLLITHRPKTKKQLYIITTGFSKARCLALFGSATRIRQSIVKNVNTIFCTFRQCEDDETAKFNY